jgi:hypothetical protein
MTGGKMSLISWFRSLFRGKNQTCSHSTMEIIDDLLLSIDEVKNNAPNSMFDVATKLLELLKNVVKRQWTQEYINNYAQSIKNGESHESFICNYIVHSCGDKLGSGRHHVYRGVLNEEGRAYLQLIQYATGIMIKKGGYTKEWAQQNLINPIMQEIKEVG